MKKRLSTDFGFDVSLKYEDREGDFINLTSQNDLNDLFLYSELQSTINVLVSEAIGLPQLAKTKSSSQASFQPLLSRGWSRGNTASSSSAVLTSSMASISRMPPRFPVIADSKLLPPGGEQLAVRDHWEAGGHAAYRSHAAREDRRRATGGVSARPAAREQRLEGGLATALGLGQLWQTDRLRHQHIDRTLQLAVQKQVVQVVLGGEVDEVSFPVFVLEAHVEAKVR